LGSAPEVFHWKIQHIFSWCIQEGSKVYRADAYIWGKSAEKARQRAHFGKSWSCEVKAEFHILEIQERYQAGKSLTRCTRLPQQTRRSKDFLE